MSLGIGCHYLDTVIHEMCHAIGMVHEQSRSDRDKYVKIITENIRSDYIYNLRKHKTYDLDAYDYESVMQYGLKDQDLEFLADAANGLTFYDAQDINHFYECANVFVHSMARDYTPVALLV
ncbi:hypothetical protein KUTeg_023545 [Tegillarca granosa]|uniref:Metalloendopeptidase n=1 Tax=Tegillarca granosa TaxID=220873 RepID=A0ABQ9E7L4_TEGGR|nr:hypothetical protein KUTeg_023545 [Tegillarca granosa]